MTFFNLFLIFFIFCFFLLFPSVPCFLFGWNGDGNWWSPVLSVWNGIIFLFLPFFCFSLYFNNSIVLFRSLLGAYSSLLFLCVTLLFEYRGFSGYCQHHLKRMPAHRKVATSQTSELLGKAPKLEILIRMQFLNDIIKSRHGSKIS